MINYPKTLHDLLKNIKSISDGEALTRVEDYVEENLLKAFGTKTVVWEFNQPGKLQGYLEGVDHFIDECRLANGNAFPGLSILFQFLQKDEAFQWRYTISFTRNSGVAISEIEEIFGANWELDVNAIKARVMQRHRIFTQPTHKMGNSPIIFKSSQIGSETAILMDLAEDGSLCKLDLIVKGGTQ